MAPSPLWLLRGWGGGIKKGAPAATASFSRKHKYHFWRKQTLHETLGSAGIKGYKLRDVAADALELIFNCFPGEFWDEKTALVMKWMPRTLVCRASCFRSLFFLQRKGNIFDARSLADVLTTFCIQRIGNLINLEGLPYKGCAGRKIHCFG